MTFLIPHTETHTPPPACPCPSLPTGRQAGGDRQGEKKEQKPLWVLE